MIWIREGMEDSRLDMGTLKSGKSSKTSESKEMKNLM